MQYIVPIVSAAIVVLLLLFLVSLWRRVPQDKAMLITGLRKRVIMGGGGIVLPIFERSDKISLENIKVIVSQKDLLSSESVPVNVDVVAAIKVMSNQEHIIRAFEQFNRGKEDTTIEAIKEFSTYVLQGKLREVVATLTVSELIREKQKFTDAVSDNVAKELEGMGLELKVFTVSDISDNSGYLDALGRAKIAEVKRTADIAEAEARRETIEAVAIAERKSAEAKLEAETRIAEAEKTKDLQVQAFKKEQETARAVADLAYQIEENKVKKEVTETELLVELTRRTKETEIAGQDALRREKELEASVKKQAEAERYQKEQQAAAEQFRLEAQARAQAEAVRLAGNAEAEALRQKALAEAEAIREKGLAEAEAMEKKAEAFKLYGEAAITQMIVERLPQLAEAVASPLAQTEKIVIVDNGSDGTSSGATKVSGYVNNILSTLPNTVEALTGIDLLGLIAGDKSSKKTLAQADDEASH